MEIIAMSQIETYAFVERKNILT